MTMSFKVLKFKLFGDFGHFGIRYTTSSPATYFIPPRHTIAGILGAILGLQRHEVSDVFHPDHSKIGIAPVHPLSILRFPLKQLLLKKASLQGYLGVKQHSIVPYQFIREPAYYIFVSLQDEEMYSTLKKLLENHECVYPPAMGLAQLLADFEYIGEFEGEELDTEEFETNSIIPLKSFLVNPKPENHVVIEKVAHYMDKQRVPFNFRETVVDIKANKIAGKLISNSEEVLKPIKLIPGNETLFMW